MYTAKFFSKISARHGRTIPIGIIILLFYLIISVPACFSPTGVEQVIDDRSGDSSVKSAIMGALLYLDDRQIRDRAGIGSCAYDSSQGDGCEAAVRYNSLIFEELTFDLPVPLPIMELKNETGEWASYVHLMPKILGNDDGETIVTVPDSSLFMTAAITYPLYFYKEDGLPESSMVVKDMRKQAMQCMNRFKRDDAYNFWVEFPGRTCDATVTGPYNIPPEVVKFLAELKLNPLNEDIKDYIIGDLETVPDWWLEMCLDESINPYGTDALFNMPNDADDTSMAVAIQSLHHEEYDPDSEDDYYSDMSNFIVDQPSLTLLEEHRDLGRSKEYFGMDAWKGEDTGAYLTWLKDEDLPTFGSPDTGVIPLGVNNVDCVVNANAVFAKALIGDTAGEGYEAALSLVVKAINEFQWPECGLYYPQTMMFPLTASRAFRDGGADNPDLAESMKTLLNDIISLQAEDGSFPGGVDPTTDLSTALGMISLLNIGRDIAEDAGLLIDYEDALENGKRHLISHQRTALLKNDDTFNRDGDSVSILDTALKWDSGLFFSASYKDLAHWRSEAYTVAIVLEALSKYVLAYDYGDVSIKDGRKIHVQSYSRSTLRADREFIIEIR